MILSIISLFMAVGFYINSRLAKKNPESYIRRNHSFGKGALDPEAIKIYIGKLLKVGYAVIAFHVIFAIVQNWIGLSFPIKFFILIAPSLFLVCYQFYSLRMFSAKTASLKNYFCIFVTILGTVGIAVLFIYASLETKAEIDGENINLVGIYGERIPLKNVNAVFMADTLPSITIRTNGIAFGSISKGYFHSASFDRRVKLLLDKAGEAPYIYIVAGDRYFIVNFKTAEKGREVYQRLKDAL